VAGTSQRFINVLKIKALEKNRVTKIADRKSFFFFFSSFEKRDHNNRVTIHINGVIMNASIFERIKNINLKVIKNKHFIYLTFTKC
jgi:hypothetical protein